MRRDRWDTTIALALLLAAGFSMFFGYMKFGLVLMIIACLTMLSYDAVKLWRMWRQ